jgi:phosphatidylethanolamine-binding protein (PEBP) family uncharacterized protein
VPEVSILVVSSVFHAGKEVPHEGRGVPVEFTCDGREKSVPMHWSHLPPHTAEIVILVVDTGRGGELTSRPVAWAVAGLPGTVHALPAGALPRGAIVGRNSFGETGYHVCPPPGRVGHYGILLWAFPKRLGLLPGFDALAVYDRLKNVVDFEGEAGFLYQRQ